MASSKLLPFQQGILERLTAPGPESDGLLLLARGLGMRSILCSFLEVFAEEQSLVVIVNATPEEDKGLAEELGMRLAVIGFEMPAKERQACYAKGGVVSITTRILIIDMLLERIPVSEMTGIVVLHAEAVTPTSMEAFVMRVYREKNKNGFIKAFSDEPESFTYGVAPLQTILTQLHIRHVFLYPRFHEAISADLEKRRGDVLNLHQPLSESMEVIQSAIIECMDATLAELKRSNTVIDVEELTVENALFRSFDTVVKSQLDPHWHRIGPKTRQLVNDLTTLRQLLTYLLSFDAVSFNQFLETILASNTTNLTTGKAVVHQSPWLFLPAADIIFEAARSRVYKRHAVQPKEPSAPVLQQARAQTEDAYWAEAGGDDSFMDDEELLAATASAVEPNGAGRSDSTAPNGQKAVSSATNPVMPDRDTPWAYWCPSGSVPVLEEQPKWLLLREILEEIEAQIHWSPVDWEAQSNDTVLVMCNSVRTVTTLRKYLSSIPELDRDASITSPGLTLGGRDLLLARATEYFLWKGTMGKLTRNIKAAGKNSANTSILNAPVDYSAPVKPGLPQRNSSGSVKDSNTYESAALKRKSAYKHGQPVNKRRRTRGGATGLSTTTRSGSEKQPAGSNANLFENEAEELAESLASETNGVLPNSLQEPEDAFDPVAFDEYFGLCEVEQTVVIRAYAGDEDDRVLEELRPRFIIVFDPDPSYVRRVETYRATHPGLKAQVYFMMYANSAEEQRYLSNIRRERESFERLIKERSTMAIPLQAERSANESRADDFLRTVSTRIAGGGKHARSDPPSVVVDVREFRSSLPSLLHAAGFVVIPVTLTIGDYVLSPEMCVERKSLPDLIQSFNSGRLYQQCEVMSTHYKIPILLIEFDQKKSFSLETYSDTRGNSSANADTDLHSKLVLLTLTFPRLRIIWSSSPYATADIYADLKTNRDEPDSAQAAAVGADQSSRSKGDVEVTVNQVPQEMLRSIPGITTKNYHLLMEKVENLEELVQLDLAGLNLILGVEHGRQLHTFINHNPLASRSKESAEVVDLDGSASD